LVELKRIKGLAAKIALTRAHLVVLRVIAAFGPALLLGAGFMALALFGAFEVMSAPFQAAIVLVFFAMVAVFGWRGIKRFEWPAEIEARNGLDRSSELRPIASLTDRPADPAPEGHILWQAHLERLRNAAAKLKLPTFGALWRAVDPYYLRAIVPAIVLVGLLFAGGHGGDRLSRALSPDIGAMMGGQNVRVEAWIVAPDHTRAPPIFLKPDAQNVRVPAGSVVTIRAQARSAPKLVSRSKGRRTAVKFKPTPDGAFEVTSVIEADTDLTVNWWGKRAGWTVLASPDAPPMVAFQSEPLLGEADKTVFTWEAEDDYGLARLELALRLVTPHPAAPDEERREPVELPGAGLKTAEADAALDLVRHPWAGLPVTAQLVATDGAGQEGRSEPYEFTLPEKLLLQTLAKAIQEARVTALREPGDYTSDSWINRLEGAPAGIQRADRMLEAITFEGHRFFDQYGLYTALVTARGVFKHASSTQEATQTDDLLWAAVLKAEYGSAADALAALLAAKKALEDALRDGASEEEIARLTDAFRQAAENYVQAKLAEAIANGLPEGANQDGLDNEQAGGGGPSVGQDGFEEMLNALEDLTETGASDQARQLLSDITNMLENLEFQQGNGSGGGGFALPSDGSGEEGEESAEQQELSEQIEELADALREQRELNDETLEARRQGRERNEQEGTGEALADRQRELGEALDQLAERGEFGGSETGEETEGTGGDETGEQADGGGVDPDALAQAREAQRRAADALERGQFGRAERNQALATERLRDIAGDLAEQLDALSEGEDGERNPTDPFGNPLGGVNDGTGVDVPDRSERQRALDILEELRERYGETEDEDERNYLERLLDRF
jgi:uncharacterized protein (TIGR02302 family)